MTTSRICKTTAVLLLSALATACTGGGAEDPVTSSAPSSFDVAESEQADSLPAAQKSAHATLPGVASASTATGSSWDEALNTLSADDRAYMESLNVSYFGALEFRTPEERAAKARMGFPSVEEWLKARRMPESELKQLADAGNTKAGALLTDRLADRVAMLKASRSPELESPDSRVVADSSFYASRTLTRAPNAFSAYLYGKQSAAVYQNPAPFVAAAFMARSLGDENAVRVINDLESSGVEFNLEQVMAIYSGMVTTMETPYY